MTSTSTQFSRLDIESANLLLLNRANAQNPAQGGQGFSGGRALFVVWADGGVAGATFNSCGVTLQFSPDNEASWVPYGGATFTSNGSTVVYLRHGWRIRALIDTADPTGINAALYYLPSD